MRWDEYGVRCEFYDWAKDEPNWHALFFRDRDENRDEDIEKGLWSEADEQAYQADCIRRSPETFRGYWTLKNLPHDCDHWDWFRSNQGFELIDPNMPIQEVKHKLQEETFNDWKVTDTGEIDYHDRVSLEAMMTYWRDERAQGEDYYGRENQLGPTQPQ